MRILLDQAVHDHRNKGNNALLEVALNRLAEFWPIASFDVISNSPYLCRVYFPGTQPVSSEGLHKVGERFRFLNSWVPDSVLRLLFEVREGFYSSASLVRTGRKTRSAETSNLGKHYYQRFDQETLSHAETGVSAALRKEDLTPSLVYGNITNYDLYVPSGGGYMVDSDKRFLLPLFNRIEAAANHGVPIVLVGQGFGRIADLELLGRAREVLPLVDLIFIREERIARPLLDSLNVRESKVFMTGDDAIAPAYLAREEQLGTGIGLSMRIASYTDVNERDIGLLRPVIIDAARQYRAELVSIPIDINDADGKYTGELTKGYNRIVSSWRKFERPIDLIKRTRRCRVMITGTFHGAVFAISQGIPVIALAKTEEYSDKMAGLAAEFGNEGCQIIHWNEGKLEERLPEALHFAWASAERLRPILLGQAERQINLGREAYQKIYNLVEAKCQERH